MAYVPIASKLSSLPLLLAGPIVRRTEPTQVSVWFVLKENRKATLQIYETNSIIEVKTFMTGTLDSGIGIGEHVFVYCITARGKTMSQGANYYYDIDFGKKETLSGFIKGGLDLTYDGSNRPSFTLPPVTLDDVRLIHGSCRKPHGEGYDAMEGVHEMLLTAVEDSTISAKHRPHQLFLTGDQIYADDVADALLYMIDDAAKALFKWNEDYAPFTEDDLLPSKRNSANKLRNYVGFTGMLPDKPEYSKSHLLKFREYATMYLFAWSDVLWPSDNPSSNKKINPLDDGYWPSCNIVLGNVWNVNSQTATQKLFEDEKEHLKRFKSTLKKVRKALANIPTYMIFDDHEITDDWNLNWRWCKEVYSKKLGRRTIQNGLLAYSLFQAWGNTPDQFDRPDKKPLLSAANIWRGADDGNFDTIQRLLNVPTIASNAKISEFPHPNYTHFDWHFSFHSNNHQSNHYSVYVIDPRTWRSYLSVESDIAFVDLISQSGLDKQFPEQFPVNEVILVVSPSPVIGEPFVEYHQGNESTWEGRCDSDTEAWALNQFAYQKFLGNLASRLPVTQSASPKRQGKIAFLSGDVHYALSARCQVWGDKFINDRHPGIATDVVFVQLTASSFKNQTNGSSGVLAYKESKRGTLTLHNSGYPYSVPASVANVPALPDPVLNFAWFVNVSQSYGKYKEGWFGSLHDYMPENDDGLIVKARQDLEKDKVQSLSVLPDWRYRVDWILGASTGTKPPGMTKPSKVEIPPVSTNRAAALQTYLAMAKGHGNYNLIWGIGKEIVGVNNLGEIRFDFSNSNKTKINHIVWWRMNAMVGGSILQLFPLTTFTIPMNYVGDENQNLPLDRPTYNGL